MRVLSRILSVWDDIAKPKTRKVFEEIVREIISVENPSYFNQGLMELGALICIPKIHRAYFVLCVSIAEDMLKVFKRITSKK